MQIAAIRAGLYALCSDGTVWFLNMDNEWEQVKAIPQ